MKSFLTLACVACLLCATVYAQDDDPIGAYAFSDRAAAGRYGAGLQFAGGANGESLPLTGLTNTFTFEAWIKPAAGAWSDLWTQMPDAPDNAIYALSLTPANTIAFGAYLGGSWYPLQTVQMVPLNAWTHVAVSYDGAKFRIYFNGVEVARRNARGNLAATSQPMRVGDYFTGAIDEVRVYSRALTPDEIALDRATPVDPAEPVQVSVVTPVDGALGVSSTPISATFSAVVDPSTVSASTFQLADSSGNLVAASVSYDSTSRTATLTPSGPLSASAGYTATIAGSSWTFRTAADASAPRAAFAFSEAGGGAAADASGNGNGALLPHGAAWASGAIGGGVFFNGNNDIQVPASDSLNLTDAFTFEAWIKPAASAWGDLWSRSSDEGVGTDDVLEFGVTSQGSLYTSPVLSGTNYPMQTTVTLALDVWTHVALTYDGTRLRIYVNGLEVASRGAHGVMASTPEPMEIGQWFHGSIDEVRIYNRALSAAEIAADRQVPVDPAPPLLVTTTTPQNGARGVITCVVSATFSASVDVATLTAAAFQLRDVAGAVVPAAVAYDEARRTATLTPFGPLAPLADYTAWVASSVASVNGSRLADSGSDVTWSFRTAAPATDPSVELSFSEGSGTFADDSSGNGNRATLVGSAGWDAGWFGTALSVPNGRGGVRVASSESIALTDQFTFEAWVRLSDYGWPQFWTRPSDDFSGGPLYALGATPGGLLDFSIWLGGVYFPLRPGAVIARDTWTHVSATYDGSTIRVFLNGAEAGARTASGALGVSNQPMEVGTWTYGRLDEVRVYRRALTPAEIAVDMATPIEKGIPRPSIDHLSPQVGVAGQLITISGAHFGAYQPSSSVTFSGVAAAIDSWTDSAIVAIVPPGVPSGPVVVTANGLASNSTAFTVVLPPVITLLAPVAGPAGQTVTITGTNFGAAQGTGGVTFNGVAASITTWGASSITAVVPAGATTGPVVVTANGVVSNGVTFTTTGPRISATLSPPPNSFGWNNGSVTVTFACSQTDSPVTFCTSPQTMSFSGAAIKVTGKAIDQNGITATMTVLLNIDLTGPAINIYSPRSTAVFPAGTTTVMLRGSAVDFLSGTQMVSCAGMPATLVGQNFSCSVPVADGTNALQVVATDIAGKTTTKAATVLVSNDIAPQSLTISPATATMFVGDTKPLAVTDDRGRTVAVGTWASSAPAIATLSIDAGVPTVHALSAGTAVLTLTLNGLSAQTTVNVYAADTVLANGTPLWSLVPTSTPQGLTPGAREVIRAVPINVPDDAAEKPPSLFYIERGPYFQNQSTTAYPTVIRAVAVDGRELWKYTLPPDPAFGGYMPVRQVIPDDLGGLIILVSSSKPGCCYAMNEVIRRLDRIGEVTWEYTHQEQFGRFSEMSLHPDGTLYVVEKLSNANSQKLVAIDVNLGAVVAGFDLTFGHSVYPNGTNATSPLVQDDGSVVVVVSAWDNVTLSSAPKTAYRVTLLSRTPPSLSVETLRRADGSGGINLGVSDFMSGPWPDGSGGLIIGGISPSSQAGLANIVHIGRDLVTSAQVDLTFGTSFARDLQYVLSDTAAFVLVQYWEGSGNTGAKAYKIDPATLALLNVFDLSGGPYVQLTSAFTGGGTLYTNHALGDAFELGYGFMAGWLGNAPAVQTAATSTHAETLWPSRRGVQSRHYAVNLKYGISIKGQFVIAPLFHTSLHVVPRNQARWAHQPGFLVDADGNWFLTIGAESSTANCGGDLVSDLNRPSDLNPDIAIYREHLQYSAGDEDRIITGLLAADSNYTDDLAYACRPAAEDIFYNSNSYTHGLLNKVNVGSPLIPELLRPAHFGWSKPVPPEEFDVR